MRSWMGAVAAVALVLAAPSVAAAGPDDPAQIQFKLPNRAAIAEFESLGLNMDHAIHDTADGGALVSAWVTDAQLANLEMRGYDPVATIADKYAIDRIRAERDKSISDEQAAKRALRGNGSRRGAQSLAPGTVRAQRADYYENNVGRFLSIEGYTTEASLSCDEEEEECAYSGPPLAAEWYDAGGNVLGSTVLGQFIDPGVWPWYYQYHYSVLRVGNKGDGGALPVSVKIAAPNGDTDTINVREWIAQNPPPPGPGFMSGFVARYYDSQEAYGKMRALAAEFPNISEAIKLPEQTRGYQRRAQTMLGYVNLPTTQQPNPNPPNSTVPYVRFDANNLPIAGSSPTTTQQPSTLVLTSKAYGHLGGNNLTAQIVNPGAGDSPLSVSVVGNQIRVSAATNTAGAITSTAAQVVAALNADPAASGLVTASLWRTSPGSGVVAAGPASPLSDLLRAPSTFPRGPQDQWMLRIGKEPRIGSRVGVFLYCQEHGNEIATSGVCLETAERLVRNYGTDPETTALVDGLEIFIVPQINGDGAAHSLYDSNRRTNLSNHCEDTVKFPSKETDPAARNSWGVDLNRNFSQGTIFDGFVGATSTDCTNGNFAGIFEFSEPETRNESWVQTTFRNIKFINNIHSSGGFFMWPPGAYKPTREPLPYPAFGTLNFFDQTGKEVLDRIKSHRGTAILPQQTGPVIDVLYSAAGNSADEAYYSNGIIGFDFEIGAQHFNDTGTGNATCNPGQQPPFGTNTTNPCLLNEGFYEAMEFASGNYGLLKEALDYSNDTTAPIVDAVSTPANGSLVSKYEVEFTSDEAASIYYTTDGSTPTTASTEYKPPRARAQPEPLELPAGTTLKWIAHDFKGNTSAVKSQKFIPHVDAEGTVTGTVPATLSLAVNPSTTFGAFTPGVTRTYLTSLGTTVTSTAGEATLTVADPSPTGTGHLVNAAFVLPQPLQARVGAAPFANVGSAAAPLGLRSWTGPASNDDVAVDFSQLVTSTDPLRTGTYSKTLTFTLSTTSP